MSPSPSAARHPSVSWPAASALRLAATHALPRFLTASVASELGILLALSLLFPFMIHLLPVPEDARLGPRLLPMFYAPLLGALLGRTRSAIGVALLAPWLNALLTGHPTTRTGIVMTIQLLVFIAVIRLLLARLGSRWFLAAPAYVACMIVSAIVVALFPALIGSRPPLPWLLNSITMGLPGVGVMLLINWLAIRYYPTGGDGDSGGPTAAT